MSLTSLIIIRANNKLLLIINFKTWNLPFQPPYLKLAVINEFLPCNKN